MFVVLIWWGFKYILSSNKKSIVDRNTKSSCLGQYFTLAGHCHCPGEHGKAGW